MDYNAPLYQNPQQTWNVKTCERYCKIVRTDACGTKYPFAGYLPRTVLGCHYAHGMSVRYNGGCVREGKWWQGEEWQLPKIPSGFEIRYKPTWGYQIIKVEPKSDPAADWI